MTELEAMARAIEIAESGRGSVSPNPLVGCVILSPTGEVLGEGAHIRYGDKHAEANAIESALAAGHDLGGATCVVTLEPCAHFGHQPPCADTLITLNIGRCVAAVEDPNPKVSGEGFRRLRANDISVDVGLMQEEAKWMNRFYLTAMQNQRPHVILKLAASLDGRAALANGESKWITSEAARKRVHEMRSSVDAVLTGRGTVEADNPSFTVRDAEGRSPLRVVMDRNNSLPDDCALFTDGGKTLLYTEQSPCERGIEEIQLATLTVRSVLSDLYGRNVRSVMIEAGPTLASSAIAEKVVDEIVLFVAPKILGGDALPIIGNRNLNSLSKLDQWSLHDVEWIDGCDDVLLRYTPNA